ncbi:RNA polymerase sigma factor [Sphingomonas quercus]|uniref:Sigma-70 family RNA polymerase sigma factor n=1 Tax=Sphingomonas quercus TaxID=2842451 RepID=A0ABS6BKG6_9SPHN|nr:sigma-70 family RNA polymerase sigma factor [Sphingomonas quercus]MBU3078112.1 sigma-70 family RNA polymerase sigma factor [Sphingomonas quercus]
MADRRDATRPGDSGEAALIERVRARDLKAFEELYRRYHPRLSRFLTNLVRRPHLVEEALNDTMMVVWHRLDGFNGASKLSTWIFAIAYRTAMKAARRQDVPIEDPAAATRESADPLPDEGVGKARIQRALAEAMAGLSPDHRLVVDLTYFHDMGYREIAEIMGCPVDTVKTRMFYARRRLRGALAGELPDWL